MLRDDCTISQYHRIGVSQYHRQHEAWIVSFTDEVIRHGPVTELIGTAVAGDLYRGRPVRHLGWSLTLFTTQTLPERSTGAPVLALYPDEALLELLSDLPNGGPIVVVPWRLREVRAWVVRTGATLLLSE